MTVLPVMGSHSYRESADFGPGRCHYCSLPQVHHLFGVPDLEASMSERDPHCTHCPEGCTDDHDDTCIWGCDE